MGSAGSDCHACGDRNGNEYGRAAMAIAWGDQWTNMIQLFWALPALGIAGLSARNIMGYLVIIVVGVGIFHRMSWFPRLGILLLTTKRRSREANAYNENQI